MAESAEKSQSSEVAEGTRGTLALVVLLTAPFLAQVDATIANVATPAIRSTLHAPGSAAQLVVGGYLVVYAVLLITGAKLGKILGYKQLFLFGITLFGLASLAAGLAPNVTVLIVARCIQGAGAAMMYPQALTGIQLTFTGQARARAVGWFAIALSGGAVLGQLFGGVLVSADLFDMSWRPIFLVNVPIVLFALLAGWAALPRTARTVDRIDLRSNLDIGGVVTLTAAALLFVLPLIIGPDVDWTWWVWVMLLASAPAMWLFVRVLNGRVKAERSPLIDITVLRRWPILGGLIALIVSVSTYYGVLFVLAQYVQQGLGKSALISGLALIPWVAAFGIAGQVSRFLPHRIQPILPALGFGLMAVAHLSAGLIALTVPGLNIELYGALALGGFGLGIGFSTLVTSMTNSVGAGSAADVSGAITTAVEIGGAIGVAGFGSLYLARASDPGLSWATTAIALAVATAIGAVIAALAVARRPASEA